MTEYRAAYVCPIDQPPLRNGIVRVDVETIAGVTDEATWEVEQHRGLPHSARFQGREIVHLGNVALLPALINAHTHLELSWLRGRVPPARSFTEWVKSLLSIRRGTEQVVTPEVSASIRDAIRELHAAGTVAVGDISNSLASVGPMKDAQLEGVVFHELLGFKERDGALIDQTNGMRDGVGTREIRISLAPHAPYSTSVELFKAIRESVSGSDCPIMSVHLGESPEEVELLVHGSGPWRSMLEGIGVWRDDWAIPACGPVEFLDRHGVLDARTLVVHGVQFDDAALARVREIGATLVTCPRSNQWVGVGPPPIERFYQSGALVAVGTDSLASVEDLNVFSELKTMRALAPDVPASWILECATERSAMALGLNDLGTLTPSKRARMIAVRLPEVVDDIEEYLVSGIEPSQIVWV